MDDALRFRLDLGLALLAGCFLTLFAIGLRQTPYNTLILLILGGFAWTVGGEYVRAAYRARDA